MEVSDTTFLDQKSSDTLRKKVEDAYDFGKGFKKIGHQSFHYPEDHESTIRKKLRKIDLHGKCARGDPWLPGKVTLQTRARLKFAQKHLAKEFLEICVLYR